MTITNAKRLCANLAMQAHQAPPETGAQSAARTPSRSWTTRDSDELTRLWKAGHNALSIAVEMGRSETSIKRWSLRLNLRAPKPKRAWSEEDKATLHHGIQAGIGLRTIALTLGRSYGAVQVYVAGIIRAAAQDRAPQAAAVPIAPAIPNPIIPGRQDDIYTRWLGAMRAQAARYPSHAG